MFVKYKIDSTTLSGSSATTINIPINLEYQIVDNAELVERVFVDIETQKAVNPILDYEKARFIPVDNASNQIGRVIYQLYFLVGNLIQVPTYYSNIGIDDSDINFRKNFFTESRLYLGFYDSDNQLTQNLVTELDVFSSLSADDYQPNGKPKAATQIPIKFELSSPLLTKRGTYEGYHLYNYKDEYSIGLPKFLYMKAAYINAKSGKSTNLMTEPTAYMIDGLIPKFYTRYKLYRDTTGFYYQVDDTYSTNVSYLTGPNNSDVVIKLYQIQVL